MAGQKITPFSVDVIEGIAAVLGDTESGLTGSQIAQRLAEAAIPDIDPKNTKWKRLYNALGERQKRDRAGNCVVAFVVAAMKPVRYRNEPQRFAYLQDGLNEVLIHAGLRLNDQGKIATVKGGAATTLSEAQSRAGTIRTELRRRGTHPEVVRYCTDELLAKNNFHALLEATKSVPSRLRALTGLAADGAGLIQSTLTPSSGPRVAINSGATDSDRSEQAGFSNLVLGLHGTYRNPTAHDARIVRTVSNEELLEALTMLSMIHRRLDGATSVKVGS